jgi:hypothetical protein
MQRRGQVHSVLPLIALLCAIARAQSGVDLAGKPIAPLEHGKPSVLIFVRTDCPISNRYAPTIQKISRNYQSKVSFWLVYPDNSESIAAVRTHLHQFGYKIAPLRDPKHDLVRAANVQITPEAAVFDSGGKLLYHGRIDNLYETIGRSRSEATTHELVDAIEAAVHGTVPASTTAPAVGCYIADLP